MYGILMQARPFLPMPVGAVITGSGMASGALPMASIQRAPPGRKKPTLCAVSHGPLKLFEALALRCGQASTHTLVTLGLMQPTAESFAGAADFGRNEQMACHWDGTRPWAPIASVPPAP